MYPRDGPISGELHGGTGGITAIVPCGEFVEMYKADRTFRVRTPESIDPGRTNPNARTVTTMVAEVGSANPIIGRVLIQSHEIIKTSFLVPKVDSSAVTVHMHKCKEVLLICDAIATKTGGEIVEILSDLAANGVALQGRGRVIHAFPQISTLEADCANYLVHVKRGIKLICEMPNLFLPLDGLHNNFRNLRIALEKLLGADHQLVRFAHDNEPPTKHFIELRNNQEHPDERSTVIRDFHVLPDGTISAPTWHIEGQPAQGPGFIQHEMRQGVDLLMDLAEALFLHLVDNQLSPEFRARIEQLPDEWIKKDVAVRFHLRYYLPELSAGTPSPGNPKETK